MSPCCSELQNRGLKDIFIACCDGLTGCPDAIKAVFPKTSVQLCIVHRVRNSLSYVSYKDRKAVAADLKLIYTASTETEAAQRFEYPVLTVSAFHAHLIVFLKSPNVSGDDCLAVDAVNNTGIDHLNFILRMETDNPTAAITLLGWGNGLVVRQSLNRLFWVYFLCQRDDRVLVVFKLAVCP